MITGVDTNVLLDILFADPSFGPRSEEALRRCLREGSLVACEVVWAETAARAPTSAAGADAMKRLGVEFSPIGERAAIAAGTAWGAYRRGGGTRQRVIADFLIGAHALLQADRLLTRDRGFYGRYFKDLKILDPSRT